MLDRKRCNYKKQSDAFIRIALTHSLALILISRLPTTAPAPFPYPLGSAVAYLSLHSMRRGRGGFAQTGSAQMLGKEVTA